LNYVTLYQVRQYLKLTASEIADDALLIRLIREINGNIDEWCDRRFDVRQETRLYDYPVKARESFGVYDLEAWVDQWNALGESRVNRRLRLDDDLLTLTALTNGDASEIESDSYVPEPANQYPKSAVRLLGGTNWQLPSDGQREQVISVAGLWGYHRRYSQAWVDSLDTVQNNPLAAVAMSLTVQDADGLAGDGETYRFQAGNMIKVGSEFLDVLDVNYSTNILTVVRGYNGTTAVAHDQGTTIYVYRPMENIVRAARRWVKYVYRQKDVDTMDVANIIGTGVRISPSAIPPDVEALLPTPRRGLDGEGLL
jgi:hypothetical protein